MTRRTWVAVAAAVVAVVALIVVLSLSGQEETAGQVPQKATPDGWQTVHYRDVSYAVPPDWTVRTGKFADGSTFDQPVYRPGYCAGHPESYRAAVSLAQSPERVLTTAVREHFELITEQAFAGRPTEIEFRAWQGSTDVPRQGALYTASPKGPCDVEKTAVYLVAVQVPGADGCLVLEVRADQKVPGAVSEADVEKITRSFRIGN